MDRQSDLSCWQWSQQEVLLMSVCPAFGDLCRTPCSRNKIVTLTVLTKTYLPPRLRIYNWANSLECLKSWDVYKTPLERWDEIYPDELGDHRISEASGFMWGSYPFCFLWKLSPDIFQKTAATPWPIQKSAPQKNGGRVFEVSIPYGRNRKNNRLLEVLREDLECLLF